MAIFSLHVSQKGPRTRKGGLRGKIRAPCIQNELALARCARHVSEKPRKSPSEDTPRKDLAMKGHLSLHGPLESCTTRESCHPASTKRPSARNPCAAEQHGTARAAHNHAAALMAAHTHSIRGASGSHTANAPTPHRPTTLRRQADVKSCAARAPQRQSAARGQRHRSTPRRHLAAASTTAVAPPGSMRTLTPQAPPHPRRPPLAVPASQTLAAPRANQQQPSAGLRFVPSKARTHHTYLSAAPVAGFSS